MPRVEIHFDFIPPSDNKRLVRRYGLHPDVVEFFRLVQRIKDELYPDVRFPGYVRVEKDVTWGDLRVHDVANLNKVLHDALTRAGLIRDDRFVLESTRRIAYVKGRPGLIVRIWEAEKGSYPKEGL